MNTQDARTLLPAAQEQLRKQAIRFKQKGMSCVAIAAMVAVHRNTVAKWWKTYEQEGAKGLRAQRRGGVSGNSAPCWLSRSWPFSD